MTPKPDLVIELIDAFRRSKAMFVAASLGVFDRLEEQPRRASDFEEKAMDRLLEACVALGLLECEDGAYRNTPAASRYLTRSSPETMIGYVLYSNQVLYPMWGNLEDAVREGSHRWKQTFDLDGPLFDRFFQTDDAMRTFLRGMHGFGRISSPRVVTAFDLSPYRVFCDLGGATGHLAVAACEQYPAMRGIVFDLPRVMPAAREYVATSAAAAARIECIGGDFFTDELPPADLYAVGRILHDWSEEKIERLLAKIRATLPEGGALLIAEKILGPVPAHLQSLNMLVCTEGRERTLAEYEALLRRAGFARVEGLITGSPLDAIRAIR